MIDQDDRPRDEQDAMIHQHPSQSMIDAPTVAPTVTYVGTPQAALMYLRTHTHPHKITHTGSSRRNSVYLASGSSPIDAAAAAAAASAAAAAAAAAFLPPSLAGAGEVDKLSVNSRCVCVCQCVCVCVCVCVCMSNRYDNIIGTVTAL
jgi:hypothetical protein